VVASFAEAFFSMSLPVMKPDRRRTPRTKPDGLAYINFGPDNGGIVLNISEGGLCFHSVAPIHSNGTVPFSFSANGDQIEAEGPLAWIDSLKKTGGIQFSDLSLQARKQVMIWTEHSRQPFAAERPQSIPHPRPELPSLARADTPLPRREPADAPAGSLLPMSGAVALKAVSQWVQAPMKRGEFSRGLATGLLLGLLVAAGFVINTHRRQVGTFLIRTGERFEATSQPRLPSAAPSATLSQPAAPSTPAPAVRHASVASAKPSSPTVPSKRLAANSPSTKIVAGKPQNKFPAQSTKLLAKNPARPHTQPAANPSGPAPATSSVPVSSAPAFPSLAVSGPASPSADKTTQPDVAAHTDASPVVAVEPVRSNENPNAEDVVEINSGMPLGKYFDVGRFKDQILASKSTNDLANFGFRAVVLPKSVLWMKSYQVLVGPYHNDQDAQLARRNLEAQGFKPHSLSKRSRQLTIVAPRQTASGHEEGDEEDFIVTWESYSADATVKFVKAGATVNTALGRWVRQPAKAGYSAIMFTISDKGSRTLLEIQFRGMTQALELSTVAGSRSLNF
jgi:PilZ domain/SPOR domain